MADKDVEIYTLQLKRIVQALKNLEEGLVHHKEYNVNHAIADKLDVAVNIPLNFIKSDYNSDEIEKDLKLLIKKHENTIAKFESFNLAEEDPLDILGKRFYFMGNPMRKDVT